MDELTFHVPTRILFGLDVLNRLGQIAAGLGSRAILVADTLLIDEKVDGAIHDYLSRQGVDLIVFGEVGPGATSTVVERAIQLSKAGQCDLVIGIGGIRSLSFAKCVARMSLVDAPFDDYFASRAALEGPFQSLPYIEIPTTCRSPFMLTDECLLVDARNRKTSVLSVGKRADFALIDPALTLTLSEKYTVSTLLDTLLSAAEAYFSRRSTFLSDTLSLRAIGIITSMMDDLAGHSDDRSLRFRASQAGLLVAMSLTMSTQGVGTALAYALSGKEMVPKSMAAAVMLPYILERGMLSQPKKVERIGTVLGEEIYGKPLKDFSVQVVDAVRQRMGLLQTPMRLKDLEVSAENLVEVASVAHAMPMTSFLAEPMDDEEIYGLLREAY